MKLILLKNYWIGHLLNQSDAHNKSWWWQVVGCLAANASLNFVLFS